jgi:hypothetical protein
VLSEERNGLLLLGHLETLLIRIDMGLALIERRVPRYCGGVSRLHVMLRKDKNVLRRALVIIIHWFVLGVRCIYPYTSPALPSVQYVLYNVPQFLHYKQCSESDLIPKQITLQTPAERTISDSQDNNIASRFISLRGGQPHQYTPSSHFPSTAS